jgi:hypothetical protein
MVLVLLEVVLLLVGLSALSTGSYKLSVTNYVGPARSRLGRKLIDRVAPGVQRTETHTEVLTGRDARIVGFALAAPASLALAVRFLLPLAFGVVGKPDGWRDGYGLNIEQALLLIAVLGFAGFLAVRKGAKTS